MPRLPNFVVVGAPKSGTTSLYEYLGQHPDIYLPARKELHYFSYPFIAQRACGPGDAQVLASLCRTQEEFVSHYAAAGSQRAVGEVSPSYLYHDEARHSIRRLLGTVKIIAILRDPVEKAYSQYMHLVRDAREPLSFGDALRAEATRVAQGWGDIWEYAGSSLYTRRVRLYQGEFGMDRVKVVLFDDLSVDPAHLMRTLFEFLEVDPDVRCDVSRTFNRTGKPRSRLVSSGLTAQSPLKSVLKRLLPERVRATLRHRVLSLNTGLKGDMDTASRQYLEEYFAEDVEALQSLLGRRLDWSSERALRRRDPP